MLAIAKLVFPVLIGIIVAFGWMNTNFGNEISSGANNSPSIISSRHNIEASGTGIHFVDINPR